MPAPINQYDAYYADGYRSSLSGYEWARWTALDHFLAQVVEFRQPVKRVLDYGCGIGLFLPLWQARFPDAALFFADISSVALQQFAVKYPAYQERVTLIDHNHVPYPDQMFDVVVSVEVMEHVDNVEAYLREIQRVLHPQGAFIWTTPCANRFSIEHLYSYFHHAIETTDTGSRRWAWEDPTHLRRLRTGEVKNALRRVGFRRIIFRFRAHFFSFVCTKLRERKVISKALANRLMMYDYKFLRRFPNGASMIGCAQK